MFIVSAASSASPRRSAAASARSDISSARSSSPTCTATAATISGEEHQRRGVIAEILEPGPRGLEERAHLPRAARSAVSDHPLRAMALASPDRSPRSANSIAAAS